MATAARDDKKMMNTPTDWPLWPCLPIKRNVGNGLETGWVSADYPTIVLRTRPSMRGILLQLACEDGLPVPGETGLRHADDEARAVYEAQIVKRYTDVDGVLDDGWIVD